ncbi:MAG: LamG domain-containing protein, partial [Candidatus Pacearchaeota archaeon]|nr:LamG domain-containing protein [Candidatus Pacearchaeota archaeon]
LGSLKISMNIESVKVIDDGIDVRVKRNSGEANLVGLNFIVSDGKDTEVFEIESNMKELATQTFSLDYDGVVDSIEVAPVLANEEGREKVYDSVNIYDDFSRKDKLESLDIVSWWKLDGNVEDSIGENDGVFIGNVQCGVEGLYGKSCEFDGTSNISVYDYNVLDVESGFTFMIWVRPYLRYSNYPIWLGYDPHNYFGIRQYRDASSYIFFEWATPPYDENFEVFQIVPNSEFETEWMNVIVTYDGDTIKGYKDGEFVNSIVGQELNPNISNLYLGYYANGTLDEVMVFNRALSEKQVEWLYEEDLS